MMFPKQTRFRSQAFRELLREIPCSECGAEDGSVSAAHANWSDLGGKGKSLKASDSYCAALCHACHCALDQGSRMTFEERRNFWMRACVKTYATLLERGLLRIA